MNFNTSPIAAEVKLITEQGGKKVHGFFYCVLFANGKYINPQKIVNIDIYRDYLNNYSDEVLIEVYMLSGDYENDIVPYKDNIEIKIFSKPYAENTTDEDLNQEVVIIQGRAILTTPENQFFSNPTSATGKETKNKMSTQKIEFQIINPMLEMFRMQSCGGIFRNMVGADLVKILYLNYSNSNDVEEDFKVKGVDVSPGFNKTIKSHITIPQGTPALEIADFINKSVEGIYPTGLGMYLQKDMWYLFSPYDVEKYTNATKTLTIVRVPSDIMPINDRTYSNKNGNVTIIVNKDTSIMDKSEIEQHNAGNGTRFANASSIMEDFVEITGNVAKASRGKNVSEFVTEARKTGLNNVVAAATKISSNMFYEMSKLSKRSGAIMDITWEYADGDILFPGMPVRFLTHQGDGMIEAYGVLLAVHEMIMLEGSGLTANKHKRSCGLSVFVKSKMDWNEQTPPE